MSKYKILFGALLIMMFGCTSEAGSPSSLSGEKVSVSIHGVNYTADPFQFSVVDPHNEKNTGGGEHIGPYAAGGIFCCFNLPAKWSPGTTVEIHSRHWLSKGDGMETSAIETKHTVEVPKYPDGKAGELWVLRFAGGNLKVVSSDLQPDHPQWPGEIKGWPIPSHEFMLKRWELERELVEADVMAHKNLIRELDSSPMSALEEAWEFDKDHSKEDISSFTGPTDEAYKIHLRERYTKGLRSSKIRLEQIMKVKP